MTSGRLNGLLHPWAQAVLVLRRLTDVTSMKALARDSGISLATAYRYLHEALEVIAQRAPSLKSGHRADAPAR